MNKINIPSAKRLQFLSKIIQLIIMGKIRSFTTEIIFRQTKGKRELSNKAMRSE
jgi:hypothetical protein